MADMNSFFQFLQQLRSMGAMGGPGGGPGGYQRPGAMMPPGGPQAGPGGPPGAGGMLADQMWQQPPGGAPMGPGGPQGMPGYPQRPQMPMDMLRRAVGGLGGGAGMPNGALAPLPAWATAGGDQLAQMQRILGLPDPKRATNPALPPAAASAPGGAAAGNGQQMENIDGTSYVVGSSAWQLAKARQAAGRSGGNSGFDHGISGGNMGSTATGARGERGIGAGPW